MTLTQKTAIAALAFAVGFATTSYAQAPAVRFSAPFQFNACGRTVPAGDYEMRADRGTHWVLMTSLDGPVSCYLPVKVGHVGLPGERGTVVFHAYGESHYLHSIQHAGSAEGPEFFISPAEREAAKAAARADVAILLRPVR